MFYAGTPQARAGEHSPDETSARRLAASFLMMWKRPLMMRKRPLITS